MSENTLSLVYRFKLRTFSQSLGTHRRLYNQSNECITHEILLLNTIISKNGLTALEIFHLVGESKCTFLPGTIVAHSIGDSEQGRTRTYIQVRLAGVVKQLNFLVKSLREHQ